MQTVPAGRPCILIVDDDEDALELSRRLVRQANPGAKVVLAQGAPQAIAYLLKTSGPMGERADMPELILLDVNMPGTDGFDVLQWVRRNRSLADIKVVMLTTSEADADIKRASELGAHGYLIKYPSPAVVACVLNQAHRTNSNAMAQPGSRPEMAEGKR